MDPNIKQSIIDRLKQTNNVLITVKNNPTVDQLAACIGLTLFLNKQGKHATAVFSGAVPSTIEFLKPEDTLEKDTNSLRDFIIALDKSKADKLRYKVEDKVVKIFITPYRTSLSEADLDFSQGDFNVDVVIALGVHAREELDQAIVAHGRILHDATVISVNNTKAADLGALNWSDAKASSLSEMVAGLVDNMQPNTLDAQMATAFLTGIVAETDRFSNPKTTSVTMSLSAKLMAAGANQQLVAAKLQEPVKAVEPGKEGDSTDNGTLAIDHPAAKKDTELPQPIEQSDEAIHIDDDGNLKTGLQDEVEKPKEDIKPSRLTLEPPTMGGTLTASTADNHLEPSIDPLSGVSDTKKTLEHSDKLDDKSEGPSSKGVDLQPTQTLSSLEEQVDSPHITPPKADDVPAAMPPVDSTAPLPAQGIDDARRAVEQAAQSSLNQPLEPVQSLNAQPLGPDLSGPQPPLPGQAPSPADTPLPPANNPLAPLPPSTPSPGLTPLNPDMPPEQTGTSSSPSAPPPVPPPLPPAMGQPDEPSTNSGGFNLPQ